MSIVPIDDIAYRPTTYEERILHYMEVYRKYERDHKAFPSLTVIKVSDISAKSKETLNDIIGGKRYVVHDGRHRLIAQKRLGYTTVTVNILRKR